jgi:inner membrane protein involved in colicin E2 resistance
LGNVLSEEMKNKFKHAHTGVAVAAVLLVIDLILFHDNESAMSAGGVVAFAACMAVMFILDEREYRARHSESERPD